MKKILVIIILFTSIAAQRTMAQNSQAIERDTVTQNRLSSLLSSYLDIKDALVAGNATVASSKAQIFLEQVNAIDYKVISEGNINVLLKDASPISTSNDIKTQRMHFANLSANMYTIGKALKLSKEQVYYDYCPMKGAYWLSKEKEIRNPYYGNTMLSCGSIKDTF